MEGRAQDNNLLNEAVGLDKNGPNKDPAEPVSKKAGIETPDKAASTKTPFNLRDSFGLPLLDFFSGKQSILGKVVLVLLGIGYLLLLVFLYLSHNPHHSVNTKDIPNDGSFDSVIRELQQEVETVSVHQVENQEQFIKTKVEMYRRLNTLEKKVDKLNTDSDQHVSKLKNLEERLKLIKSDKKISSKEQKELIQFFTSELRDEVRSTISKTLEDDKLSDEISKAVLSRLGRTNQINIAQKAAGAQISDHSKGYDHTKKSIISSIAKVFTVNPLLIDPSIVLEGSDVELGECYPLKKEKTKEGTDKPSYITIKLPKEEPISGVTISHIPSGLTPSFTSAPRDFTATCIYDVPVSSESKKLKKEERLIAEGSFDPELLPHQTFEAQKFDIEGELKHLTCKSVRFEFVNNYGNEDYTCIYRLQVHSGNNDKYAEDNVKILKGYQK